MTVKDISKMTGRTERAVRKWVIKAAEKSSAVCAEKSSADGHGIYVDYPIEETIEIMKAGKVSDFIIQALINETNRANQPDINPELINRLDRIENMIMKLCGIVANIQQAQPAIKQPEIKALPAPVQKIEVSIVDLPDTLARVASAAVNNKLKSEARKKLLDELQDDLFN